MIKARIDLDANEKELTRRFGLAELPIEKWRWRKMRIGLRRWHKEYPDWMKPDAQFTAKEAWTAYLRRNQFWPRLIRVGVLLAIHAVFPTAFSRFSRHRWRRPGATPRFAPIFGF
jgi:hypothetical protein